MARVFIIGRGGREHALARILLNSPGISRIFCYPGNGGISEIVKCPKLGIPVTDTEALLKFATENRIDLTIVGPEAPLVASIADRFWAKDKLLLGPTQAASRLEGSKIFAKEFMQRNNIPTAEFQVFENVFEAR